MKNKKRVYTIAVALTASVGLLCSSCASASHTLSVLESTTSSKSVPVTLEEESTFASGSIRFLANSGGESYFAAKAATAPEHEVCLIRFDDKTSDWASGCSTVGNDLIVTVDSKVQGSSRIGLIADNPSTKFLEDNKWEKLGENVWHQSNSK